MTSSLQPLDFLSQNLSVHGVLIWRPALCLSENGTLKGIERLSLAIARGHAESAQNIQRGACGHTQNHRLQTYTKIRTDQCMENFVRRDHAHRNCVHGDHIHDWVQVEQGQRGHRMEETVQDYL